MGVCLYPVWPTLYSTVTDSYRLSRTFVAFPIALADVGGAWCRAVAITDDQQNPATVT